LGNFNILTISAIPAFLSSVFSILIERPSRRTLLCLYVSNVATETLWNMALSRNMVRNIKYGDTAIFAVGMAVLLTYYKSGYHKQPDGKTDSMFGVLRLVDSKENQRKINTSVFVGLSWGLMRRKTTLRDPPKLVASTGNKSKTFPT
jgi:hypothetical protein